MKNLDKDLSFTDQFLVEKSQEDEPEKTNTEAEVQSMVTVPIHQDTSSVPLMTTPVIDITDPQSDSTTVPASMPTTTATVTETTTTTVPPPPPQPQQDVSTSILTQTIGQLEQNIADLVDANQALEERLDKQGNRIHQLETQDLSRLIREQTVEFIDSQEIDQKIEESVKEVVTASVQHAMRAPLRARFKDLPTSDMKEILLQRMLEENYDKGHEDHKMAYEALQKSIIRDESEKFDADKAEERTKKKSKQDSPKTPPGSPPSPPPPPPPSGASGASGTTGASDSAQDPPPPPPSSTTNRGDQSQSSAAPGSSKTAASTTYTAWTTTTSRLKPAASSVPENILLHEESDSKAQDMVSDDEDSGSRNEITRFQQRFDESFYEAWDRFNDLLRACPHHGFSELHQLDTFYNALNSNDQDSLNSAAGGNFLDKMPPIMAIKIIESKSKVRNSRSKPVVAKVSTSTSTSGISPDVSELKDMVKALLLDKKNQSQAPAHQTPASVKAVEESCVTCGGAHSYQSCPATDGNVYHDNIQAYVSQAAAANFNQGNTSARPPMVANQIRPPGFPPMQNHQNNQNRGNNFNQNRGNNFSQGPIYQPQVNQPPTYQAPVYQAPAPQTQGVSKTDFDSYVKANDAVMRNVQNQGQNLQAQLNNLATSNQRLESMLSNFIKMNTASTSGSGTLPGNTVTNPKEDLKGITTRSGVAYQGPAIPSTSSSPPKVMNRDTEVTKDTMLPTNNGSTEDVQPPVIQVQSQNPTSKPDVDPDSAPMPNQRTSIPFPSRRNDERRREKANDQIEKFYEIFREGGNFFFF
ncbi:hypothetical protein Tco_0104973 [Tanacetum coccineum]